MILVISTIRMSFTLKETNQLYKNIISNGMIPKNKRRKRTTESSKNKIQEKK